MSAPSAKDIHEAAETAILTLLLDPKASATFQGRSYATQDLDKLQKISEIYRAKAVQRGEIKDASLDRSIDNYLDISGITEGL
jgi:hypothetical protein